MVRQWRVGLVDGLDDLEGLVDAAGRYQIAVLVVLAGLVIGVPIGLAREQPVAAGAVTGPLFMKVSF